MIRGGLRQGPRRTLSEADCKPMRRAGCFPGRQDEMLAEQDINGADEIDAVLGDVGVALGSVPHGIKRRVAVYVDRMDRSRASVCCTGARPGRQL